jgi:cystathionine beta-lyase family protein involved in aluminum resistance
MKTKSSMEKILDLYREHGVDSSAFNGVNGYGHGDLGREKFDDIVARLMGAEAALVRLQLFSGTHAISTALFGALRPGQSILGVSGHPYDTLEEVLGLRNSSTSNTNKGSLRDWGIGYHEVGLLIGESAGSAPSGVKFDLAAIDAKLAADSSIKVIHIQR